MPVIETHLMVQIQQKLTSFESLMDVDRMGNPRRTARGLGSHSPDSSNTNDNAFPQKEIYFHRKVSHSAPAHEFWGFFSLNSDPTAETGLNHCMVNYKLCVS